MPITDLPAISAPSTGAPTKDLHIKDLHAKDLHAKDLHIKDLHIKILDWYSTHARDLPWRRPDAGAWAVLVSEVMLQQTPVARVLPAHGAWLTRWPTPAALAADSPGEAVRQWQRLGYPRRALRLHAAAAAIVERHDGVVPRDHADLLALPGVGSYTAAAVASFAYGRRHVVLDTNVRRVFARVITGVAQAGTSPTRAETVAAEALLPEAAEQAARWAVATMELGALICTARAPKCDRCPVAEQCRWRAAGKPEPGAPGRRQPAYEGSDRQARGRLLAALRDTVGPLPTAMLLAAHPDPEQAARALRGLVADGLVSAVSGGHALP